MDSQASTGSTDLERRLTDSVVVLAEDAGTAASVSDSAVLAGVSAGVSAGLGLGTGVGTHFIGTTCGGAGQDMATMDIQQATPTATTQTTAGTRIPHHLIIIPARIRVRNPLGRWSRIPHKHLALQMAECRFSFI
jgi:hypothetical protein